MCLKESIHVQKVDDLADTNEMSEANHLLASKNDSENKVPKCTLVSVFTLCVLKYNKSLRWLGVIAFCDNLTEQMLVQLLLIYLKTNLHFDPFDSTILLIILGMSCTISLLCVVRLLKKLVGDHRMLQIGLLANAVSVFLYAFASKKWEAFAIPSLCMLSFVVFPGISSLVSTSTDAKDQGKVQGAINGLRMLAEGISPLVFAGLFQICEHTLLPGAPFIVAASLIFSAFVISIKCLSDL